MKKTKQVVILAAGNGTRLWPLTARLPKPFLPILGRSIIERKLDILSDLVKEAVLVVGKNKEEIISSLGDEYRGLKIKYVVQEERLGTGHALKSAEDKLRERFLVLNGDDIYGRAGIEEALQSFPCILAKRVKDISRYGALLTKGKQVAGLVEKPEEKISEWANIGVYHLPREALREEIGVSERGEYEITDYVERFCKKNKLYWAEARDWRPVTYPWDLLEANQVFLQAVKRRVEGRVEKGAVIKGDVFIGEGALVRSGSYIEGPAYIGISSEIGPNSYVRPLSIIEGGCRVGHAVEIKASLIMEDSRVSHLSYVGDSVVGRGCNLGAGTITANLRFNGGSIKAMTKDQLLDTGRKKFGAILGDGAKTGINVSLMPGVMIGPGAVIAPHTSVSRNVS